MLRKAAYVLEMTKPPQLALLAFTAFASYFAAGGSLSAVKLGLLAVTSLGAIGGVTALNMALEVDLDSIMTRTSKRPVPSGRLTRREALIGSLVLIAIGFAAAALINWLVLLTCVLALVFDIPIYTVLLKRRSPLNIIAGGVAGVMPTLGGWATAAGSIGLPAILLALAVFLWIPMHIWFIVYYHIDDYRRAKVPMYPVVAPPQRVAKVVVAFMALMAASMWLYWALTGKGLIGDALLTPLAAWSSSIILRYSRSMDRGLAKIVFRTANPVLIIAFLGAVFSTPHLATLVYMLR
ncbi:MAG: protoheme IX farnesyltransferase [uncultured Acidilobus sp. CIS]|nr:MAG: protoheme IX farnesyltransferase [uncultured Acidilobus sp. CIS]